VLPSVSVVICAYSLDRWDDLAAAVASVGAQSPPPLETIVVVDHNDALLERARRELEAVVVPSTGRPGLSHARNAGIAAAQGEVVAFLDDDAAAEPGWLAALAAPYEDPAVVAVGGAVEPRWLAGRPSTFPPEFDWVVGCTYRGHPTERKPVRNVIGANMSFRRSVFEEVGGFDADIGRVGTRPVGCEETELCIRAGRARAGAVVLYEPAARVRHAVPPARATWGYFVRRCFGEGLSKAVVARLAGRQDALSTERGYVARTVAGGIVRDTAALGRGDVAGPVRALRMALGLGAAAAGYGYALVADRR
jgi:glycosyltransferase involved in cell wall biosynthesis